MKSYKFIPTILILSFLFTQCRETPIIIEEEPAVTLGTIKGQVRFNNEYDERISPSVDNSVIILLEGDEISKNIDTDFKGKFEFNDLPLGVYRLSTISEGRKFGTCKVHTIELTEEEPIEQRSFEVTALPTANIDMFRIDSFVNQWSVYRTIITSPEVNKKRVIRVYYGNDRTVSKDNYVYTNPNGGFFFHDNTIDRLSHEYIDINKFSPSQDSIYVAVYLVGAHYERCWDPEQAMNTFSPAVEPPFIVGFKK